MKTWNEFIEAQMGASDHSLEGFKTVLDQLQLLTNGVTNPQAKAEVGRLVANFNSQMKPILMKYHQPGNPVNPYASNMQPYPTPDLRA